VEIGLKWFGGKGLLGGQVFYIRAVELRRIGNRGESGVKGEMFSTILRGGEKRVVECGCFL
jgi:hypothetical protein